MRWLSELRGWGRATVALLVPWFLYWGWRLFTSLQAIWALKAYRFSIPDEYGAARAERDHVLFVAFGVPIAIAVVILTARWVLEGFKREEPPSDL